MSSAQSFDYCDFLRLANELHKSMQNTQYPDACYRTIISKSYYALYLVSRDLMEKKYGVELESGPSTHEQVRRFFEDPAKAIRTRSKNKPKPQLTPGELKLFTKVSGRLEMLSRWRKAADYNLTPDFFRTHNSKFSSISLDQAADESIKTSKGQLAQMGHNITF